MVGLVLYRETKRSPENSCGKFEVKESQNIKRKYKGMVNPPDKVATKEGLTKL